MCITFYNNYRILILPREVAPLFISSVLLMVMYLIFFNVSEKSENVIGLDPCILNRLSLFGPL